MCGGNPPGASHAEIQRTRTETVFLRQAEQQETRTAQTQAIQQETAQATQTAAPPLTVFARTAQQEAQKSGCARRSAEKQLQKNREESKKRAKKYEKSRNPEQLLETYLREQEESLGTFQIEQEGGEELNELTQAGLSLEYQAMKQVKDPVKARDFFDKIRYFQNCIRLTQKSILQASVRRYVLMPRLQAEGRLNEDECAAICAHHQKSMGSLTTLRGYVEELKTGLKSLLPEGEQLNEASGEELAQYESQILQRAVQRAGRTEREKPDGEIIGEKRARVQAIPPCRKRSSTTIGAGGPLSRRPLPSKRRAEWRDWLLLTALWACTARPITTCSGRRTASRRWELILTSSSLRTKRGSTP